MTDDIIPINAGGQLFAVKRSTLLVAPEGSFLNAMFSTRWENDTSLCRDKDGNIFLDVSPPVFAAILSKLRAMALSPDGFDRASIPIEKVYQDELKSTINYYGVFPHLQREDIDLKLKASAPRRVRITEESDGVVLTATREEPEQGGCKILGVESLQDGAAWKVSVRNYAKWFEAGIMAYTKEDNSTRCIWSSRRDAHNTCDRCYTGDVLVFKLDSKALRMYHSSQKRIYHMEIVQEDDLPWRLSFLVQGNPDQTMSDQTSLKISQATTDDLLPFNNDGTIVVDLGTSATICRV